MVFIQIPSPSRGIKDKTWVIKELVHHSDLRGVHTYYNGVQDLLVVYDACVTSIFAVSIVRKLMFLDRPERRGLSRARHQHKQRGDPARYSTASHQSHVCCYSLFRHYGPHLCAVPRDRDGYRGPERIQGFHWGTLYRPCERRPGREDLLLFCLTYTYTYFGNVLLRAISYTI